MAFVQRTIDLKFTLGTGAFGEGGADTVEVTGLRVSASIIQAGNFFTSELQLRVWGMPLDTMAKLTILNMKTVGQLRNNTVTVIAGDSTGSRGVVFVGTIMEAWADASNPPDMVFTLRANAGALSAVKPIPPTSFKGPVDADTFFTSLARQITDGGQPTPYSLENSGVVGTLDSPYYSGSALEQIKKGAAALDCNGSIDTVNRVVAIWPGGQPRGASILDISPETGLVGYPQFTQNGVAFSMLFNPAIFFNQQIKLTSTLSNANGTWVVAAIQHTIDAELPGGQWFTRVECGLLGSEAPVINAPS